MKEKGFNISKTQPKLITGQMVQEADVIIIMGCSGRGFCPAPMLNKVADWQIEDPEGKSTEKVGETRDEIERRVKNLIDETA